MSRNVDSICSRISQQFASSLIDNCRFVIYTITIYTISAIYSNFVAFPLVNFRSWIATLTLGLFSFQVRFPRVLSPSIRSIWDYRWLSFGHSSGRCLIFAWWNGRALLIFLKRIPSKKLYRYFYYSQYFFLASIIIAAVVSLATISGDHWHLLSSIPSLSKLCKISILPVLCWKKKQIFEMKQRKGCTVFNDRHLTRDEPKDPVVSWPWWWKQQRI